MTHVRTPGGSTSLPAGPAHSQAWHGPKKKASSLAPSPHPIRHHLIGAAWLSETPTINTRNLFLSVHRSFLEPPKAPDMKTLRSLLLLCHLHLDNTISVIHRSDYVVGSSPLSEHCYALISMQGVMNSGEYLCMTILQSSDAIWVVTKRS